MYEASMGKGKDAGIEKDDERKSAIHLESLTGNEDEQATDGRIDEHKQPQHGSRPRIQSLANEGLSYPVEVEKSVLAVANHSYDGVKHVLMCEDEVKGHREGQDDLFSS